MRTDVNIDFGKSMGPENRDYILDHLNKDKARYAVRPLRLMSLVPVELTNDSAQESKTVLPFQECLNRA
jgi:hypothetical protein